MSLSVIGVSIKNGARDVPAAAGMFARIGSDFNLLARDCIEASAFGSDVGA